MGNYKGVTAETKNDWETCFKSTNSFQRNSLDIVKRAKWRYMPKEYGNWNSIYHKFRQWITLGIFEKILKAMTNSKYSLLEMVSIFYKVHQNATDPLKKLDNQAIVVSRGRKTTRIHVMINENNFDRRTSPRQ